MWQSHQRYGKLPWKDLFEPVIEICENGFNATKANAIAIEIEEKSIRNSSFNLSFVHFFYSFIYAEFNEKLVGNILCV